MLIRSMEENKGRIVKTLHVIDKGILMRFYWSICNVFRNTPLQQHYDIIRFLIRNVIFALWTLFNFDKPLRDDFYVSPLSALMSTAEILVVAKSDE